jgi:endonuclease G, mitochondrial
MMLTSTTYQRWQREGPPEVPQRETLYARVRKAESAPNLANRIRSLTADGQAATPLEHEALLGSNDLVEANFIDRCRIVMGCVGRLRLNSERGRGFATGFMVAPGLLMTNHHVLPDAGAGANGSVEFGYQYDVAGKLSSGATFDLRPSEFYVSDEEFDFAVVAVQPISDSGADLADRGYLRLNPESGKVKEGDFVTIIQYPDGLPMRIALRENEVTRADPDAESIWYQADTAHGSSGAPVFNDSLQIAALHSSGRIKRNADGEFALANGGFTTSLDGLGEADVIWEANVGFRVSRLCPRVLMRARTRSATHHQLLESAMAGGDVLATAVATITSDVDVAERELARGRGSMSTNRSDRGVTIPAQSGGGAVVIPLQLRVSLELGGTAATAVTISEPPAIGAATEVEREAFRMKVPVIFDGLEDRGGFDRKFLDLDGGVDVPMPRITTSGNHVLAPMLDGSGHELKYHKFSIWMQKNRRLALFTASNVDWRARQKVVDGKKTDRDTLAGFDPVADKFVIEQWVSDDRIAPEHQLPDVFYTEDRGSFDKGHLVRRDDMCWGTTFEDIQMGNGDTYHVTNCSPQTAAFNQGAEGEENWGDLESHVQKATKKDNEKVVIYAGPIFSQTDRFFRGKDDAGAAKIQIPSRYWKIVVTKLNGKPAAYGFLLKQDVRAITEKEFFVTDEWIGSMIKLSALKTKLRGWLKLDELIAVDQFDVVNGN